MLAVAVRKDNELEIVQVPNPEPGPYEAVIRTECAAICNMTDRKLVEGHFPGVETYPLLLGHETAGTVQAVGDKVRNFKVGDRVIGGLLLNTTTDDYASGWGGFCEYVISGDHVAMTEDGVANADNAWFDVYEIMTTIPDSVSIEDGVMLCMWREVYSAIIDDFRLRPGEDMLIYGDGPVGLSFVKFARLLGFGAIYLVGKYDQKLQKAMEMGATGTFKPDDPALADLVKTRGKPFDSIIDAVGKEDIINASVPMIRMGGTIGVYGVIDASEIQLKHGAGPYNFNLMLHQWPTREYERAAQAPLVEWIEDGKLSYKEFTSGEYPIHEIREAYAFSKEKHTIKTLLRYD